MRAFIKKLGLSLLVLILLPLGYCSLPLKDVTTIVLKIRDGRGKAIETPLTAAIIDSNGQVVIEKESTILLDSAWIDFWSNSADASSLVAPKSLYQAKSIKITGEGCQPVTFVPEFTKEFVGLSFSPHGGGPAYMYYHLEKDITMDCQSAVENPTDINQ